MYTVSIIVDGEEIRCTPTLVEVSPNYESYKIYKKLSKAGKYTIYAKSFFSKVRISTSKEEYDTIKIGDTLTVES